MVMWLGINWVLGFRKFSGLSLEDLYYKRINRKHTTLSHNYTHTMKKKKTITRTYNVQECALDR